MEERRIRGWIFTIHHNECTGVDIDTIYDALQKKTMKWKQPDWIVCGKEVCPTSGRQHLQGALYFKNGKTRKAFQKWTGGGKHFAEERRGSPKANKDYCSKEGFWFENGEAPHQGKRNDIVSVREALMDGASMRNIVMTTTNLQGIQYASKFLTSCERERNWKTELYWYWGDTGTGKSKKAAAENKGAYWANDTSKWWDGYDAHEVVIIDDMRGNWCMFNEFLKITDRYPYRVEVKGGFRQLLAKKIIVTSCKSPSGMWNVFGENIKQLERRITKVEHFE